MTRVAVARDARVMATDAQAPIVPRAADQQSGSARTATGDRSGVVESAAASRQR